MLGKTYFMRGEFGKALTELETALKLAPKDLMSPIRLDWPTSSSTVAPAKQIYTRMLRQLGDRPQLHIIFGRAYRETGFLAEAIEVQKGHCARSQISTRPLLSGTYLPAERRGLQFNEAAEEFKIELAANPDDYFANYYLGIIHLRRGGLNRQISLLEKASRLQPDNPDPYFYLGQAYQALEKHLTGY